MHSELLSPCHQLLYLSAEENHFASSSVNYKLPWHCLTHKCTSATGLGKGSELRGIWKFFSCCIITVGLLYKETKITDCSQPPSFLLGAVTCERSTVPAAQLPASQSLSVLQQSTHGNKTISAWHIRRHAQFQSPTCWWVALAPLQGAMDMFTNKRAL